MQSLRFLLIILLLPALIACTTHHKLPSTAQFQLIKKTSVAGDGFWDYLTVDAETRTLYLSHGSEVVVLNADTHALLAKMSGKGVHGVTMVPDLKIGFITNGAANTVSVFDALTFEKTAEIPVGKNPDAAVYDPFTHQLFIFCADSDEATVIDPAGMKVVGTVALGGAPEAGVTDGKGHIYVNLEDKSEIVAFDAKTLKVLRHIALGPGEEPTGLAIDAKNGLLFSACHNQLMIVLDANTGKILANLPIGKGVDGLVFDADRQIAISSNGAGSLTVVQEISLTAFLVVQTVTTERGARTIALDTKTHHVFTATAQYGETPPPTAENPEPRPKIVPGTFKVLEYGA